MTSATPLSEADFSAIVSLVGSERFAHFLRQAIRERHVWGLRDSRGWAGIAGREGELCFPVWPHPRFAEACAVEDWARHSPTPIKIEDWIEEWLPALEADGAAVAVFPIPQGQSVIVSGADLQDQLLGSFESVPDS